MSDEATASKLDNRLTVFLRLNPPTKYADGAQSYSTATIGSADLETYKALAKQAQRLLPATFEVRQHGDGVKIWRMK